MEEQQEEKLIGREFLRTLLNKTLKIRLTDGRTLVGTFLCVDRDANIIIGSATECTDEVKSEPRVLGLAMVPGRHATFIQLLNYSSSCSPKPRVESQPVTVSEP